MLTTQKKEQTLLIRASDFNSILFVITAQCINCLFDVESSFKSILISNGVCCILIGILQSLSNNKKFNKKDIKIIDNFIDNFGNTFTSFSSLIKDINDDGEDNNISYQHFLFSILICFLLFQISLTFIDRILNINNFYGKIHIDNIRKKGTIHWNYIYFSFYFIISSTYLYFIFVKFKFFELNNCLFASLLSYYITFYFSNKLSIFSIESMCYFTNIVSCILVMFDNKLFIKNYYFHLDIFIISFSSCFSQFVTTIIYTSIWISKDQSVKAMRFIIVNVMIGITFVTIF